MRRSRLDPDDRSVAEGWFESNFAPDVPIQVPGCWQGQDFGTETEHEIMEGCGPMWTFHATYTGTGWYARTFSVPPASRESRVWLNLGATSAGTWRRSCVYRSVKTTCRS